MHTLHTEHEPKAEKLEDMVSHILEEARMVLPGIQALLGFQLVCVFNRVFADIDKIDQYIHVVAIFLSINAICFLLTPAALHRQCNPELLTKKFAMTASGLIFLGMLPLLFSIVLDAYVVVHTVTKDLRVAIPVSLVLCAELLYCWVIMPRIKNLKSRPRAPLA